MSYYVEEEVYYIKWEENMKEIEFFRKIDELGRVLIPLEIRRLMEWQEKDMLEIIPNPDSGTVTLKRKADQ